MNKRAYIFVFLFVVLIVFVIAWGLSTKFINGIGPYDSNLNNARSTTLWDWLDLLVVPVIIALAAWFLSVSEKMTEKETEDERQRQETLEKFYERISNLILEKKLHKCKPNSSLRGIARTWALAAFHRLDASRKSEALHFLYRANVIDKDPIINLNGANLRNSDLQNAVLIGAEIRGAYFTGSNMRGANLKEADLTGSDFCKVDLRGSLLNNTNLSFTTLNRSDLRNLDLSFTNMYGADIRGARIWGIIVREDQTAEIRFSDSQETLLKILNFFKKKEIKKDGE